MQRLRNRWSRATRLGGLVAAGLVVIISIAVLRQHADPTPIGAGARLAPDQLAAPFDPTVNGAGIVSRPDDIDVILAMIVATVVGAGAILRIRRTARLLILGVIAVAALGVIVLARYDFVGWTDGSWAFGVGYASSRQGPGAGHADEIATYVVPPNGVLTFGLDVHNRAQVPITIIGLAANEHNAAWGDVTAVGLLRDPNVVDLADPANTRPFAPTEVPAGAPVFLIVAGRATACALGRANTADLSQAGATIASIDVVYEIAGIRRLTTVHLPFTIEIPMDASCMSG